MHILDAHSDAPMWMLRGRDYGKDNPGTQVDFPKMLRSGVCSSFFALYVPSSMSAAEAADYADSMLAELKRQVAANPDKAAFATDAASMEANAAKGLVSVFIGLENGSALLGRTDMLEYLYAEGVRYVTLCHSADNGLCDSCTGLGTWGGLSAEGRRLVGEMNEIGMVIDLAHTSDATKRDVLELSRKPVAYTHGCCSAICSHKRNISDELMRSIAEKNGVVCISVFPPFLTDRLFDLDDDIPDPRPMPGVEDVVRHIVHAVKIAGVGHVGIGTDFDGINHTPTGLESIEKLPFLFDALRKKGFSEGDLSKMASENLLRVISAQK